MENQLYHRMMREEELNELSGREAPEKRTRGGKVFDLGGGLYQAVLFSDSVHFRDAKGNWEEIDNRLCPCQEENGALKNCAGETEVTLHPASNEQLISIARQGYTLSWALSGASSVVPAITPCVHDELNPRLKVLQKSESDAVYENILPDVDLRCHLNGGGFKEDVIFNSYESTQPLSFVLNAPNMTLSLNEENAVIAKNDQQEILFTLPAPFMLDSELMPVRGEVSALLSLLDAENSRYQLTYTPDAAYLENALYPVTLDPVVVYTDNDKMAIETTYVDTNQPDEVMPSSMSTCPVWNYGQPSKGKNMYLRFKQENLPVIDSSYYVTKAFLRLTIASAPDHSASLYLNEVTEAWPLETLTAANQPSISPEPIDYVYLTTTDGEDHTFEMDISNLVRKWYTGVNYGMMLDVRNMCRLALYANKSVYKKPYVVINYVSLAGLEGYMNYETQPVGRAGTGHVSLYNGNLVFEHGDTAMNGNRMPVSISHYYNSCYHGVDAYHVGRGWKLSTQHTLHKEAIDDNKGNPVDYYVYTDGDGTRHYFKKTSGIWKDLSGLALTLTLDTTAKTAVITNKGDQTMTFALPENYFEGDYANVKFLQETADALNTKALYAYQQPANKEANASLTDGTVKDGAERVTRLKNISTLLSSIVAPYMSTSVDYTYTNGLLTAITHEDGKQTTYQYDENDLLTSVCNEDQLRLTYAYTAAEPYRVTSATLEKLQDKGTPISISKRKYDYRDCLTVVTDCVPNANGSGFVDGKRLFYHFNDNGNCVSVNDELGFGSFTQYSSELPINHPETVSRLQRSVPNLLKNHNFLSTTSTAWVADKLLGSGTCGYSSEQNYIGGRAYKLYKSSTDKTISTFQVVKGCKPGQTYTFSVYYRTTSNAAVQLRADCLLPDKTVIHTEGQTYKSPDAWSRVGLTFTVPENATEVKVRILAAEGKGSVYADGAQLETGTLVNRHNLLHNGDFSFNDTGAPEAWSLSDDFGAPDGVYEPQELSDALNPDAARPASISGNILRLYGKPNTCKLLTQNTAAFGKKGDVYVLGGWASAKARPRSTGGKFRLELYARPDAAEVGVAAGQTPSFRDVGVVEWSEEWTNWQFAAAPIVMPWKYSSVGIRIRYENNLNTADFSDLFLYKERFGKTYDYDGNGNVTTVENLAASQSGAKYDDCNNVISYHQPGRNENYTFNYGTATADKKKHLPISSKSPLDIRQSFAYDNFGNVVDVQTKNASNTLRMAGKTSYTEKGNYVATQTDARGKTVTSVTDLDAGTLTSVTDPVGQTVQYTYDVLRRTTAVQTTADGKTYKNEYAYDESNRLSCVAHNTITEACDVQYHFGYDALGRATTVSVGAQPLSTNAYNSDGTLHEVTYGNGAKVSYNYDDYKRVTGLTYDNETAPRYRYEFAANGRVARAWDDLLHRTATSEYDLANRPARVTHLENVTDVNHGEHLYTGEVSYDDFNNLKTFKELIGATKVTHQTTFEYDIENKPNKLIFDDATKYKLTYAYDTLGRMATRTMKNDADTMTTAYAYVEGGYPEENGTNKSTTSLIQSITQGTGDNAENFAYTYDDVGNITSVARNGIVTTYEYDKLGQLTRTNDPFDKTASEDGTTWLYVYDQGGNILKKCHYPLTINATLLEPTDANTVAYSYENPNWKDQLTAYNGQTITYDQIGNPLNDGTWIYEWQNGRQLKSMTQGTPNTAGYKKLDFVYNADGLRIQKKYTEYDAQTEQDNITVTDYILHGKNIIYIRNTLNSVQQYALHYFYDASGKPTLFSYTTSAGETYYTLVHNLQGDVVGIRDVSGNEVVRYTYNAWGKLLSTTGNMASTLGCCNLFRYRGYVFDEETGLYYLRSRYYNTTWNRFVNSDTLLHAGMGILGQQLFLYCANNPIVNTDPSGKAFYYAMITDSGAESVDYYNKTLNKAGKVLEKTKTYPPYYGYYKEEKVVLIPISVADEYFFGELLSDDITDTSVTVITTVIEKTLKKAFPKLGASYAAKILGVGVCAVSLYIDLSNINYDIQLNKAYNEAKEKGTGIIIITMEMKEVGNGFRYLGNPVTTIQEWSNVLTNYMED